MVRDREFTLQITSDRWFNNAHCQITRAICLLEEVPDQRGEIYWHYNYKAQFHHSELQYVINVKRWIPYFRKNPSSIKVKHFVFQIKMSLQSWANFVKRFLKPFPHCTAFFRLFQVRYPLFDLVWTRSLRTDIFPADTCNCVIFFFLFEFGMLLLLCFVMLLIP